MKQVLSILSGLLFGWGVMGQATRHVISNAGFDYTPDYLEIQLGDTVSFELSGSHDAVEVSRATWMSNGSASNGGFVLGFGGGEWIPAVVDTFYYVCTPHASMGMKGRVVVRPALAQPDLDSRTPGLFAEKQQGGWCISAEAFTPSRYMVFDLQGRLLETALWPEESILFLRVKGLSVLWVQGVRPGEQVRLWLPE